jgi:ribulose-phosphate 3-epimerase
MMKLLAPSVLAADFTQLNLQIRSAELGGADWIHCDVMDGHFVPNISFGPVVVKSVRRCTKLPVDVHLMIEDPDLYINDFADAGADYITVHLEAVHHLNRTIQKIRETGKKAGVSINPATPVSLISDIAEYIDLLLIMSVNPGFGGQSFIESSLRRIKEAAELRHKLNASFLIEVDGGISKHNIKKISDAGCEIFVAGSSIFGAENITAAAAELKNLIKG